MNELSSIDVESKIITLREQQVILDCDVAELYGVETKRINEAVSNNPEKFPIGYVFELDNQEFGGLRSKNSTAKFQKTRQNPKAFTEKGLYMLATILKSPRAVQTTLAIVETYAKLKELSRVIVELPNEEQDEQQRQSLLQRGGKLLSDIFDSTMPKHSSETSFELNLALLKLKHSVKRENENNDTDLKKVIAALTQRIAELEKQNQNWK
ncbi:MAG: ORF6N domain-containing protein [Bacteroidales bacterium]|nr:ORF6N domain-containing protein [Bacteroidales bacterium]